MVSKNNLKNKAQSVLEPTTANSTRRG